jgi:hypothetical protein
MLNRPVARPRLLTFAKFSVKATGFSAVLLRMPDAIATGGENECSQLPAGRFSDLFYRGTCQCRRTVMCADRNFSGCHPS